MSVAGSTHAEPDRDSLTYALRVLRRRWIVLAVAVVSCLAVGSIVWERQTDRFESSSRVLFGTSTLSDAALQVNRSTDDPEREAATNVLLARSEAVAAKVRKTLGLSEPVHELRDEVSVEAEENANIVRITVSDPDARRAAALANAFAKEFIAFRAQGDVQSIEMAEKDLRDQLRRLPADAGERQALEDSLQRLTSLRALATGDARVITTAEVADAPANPGAFQILVLAGIIGVALGLAGMFLLDSFDRRVGDIDEFEQGYRLRALTVVPQRAFRARAMDARSRDL